MIQVHVLRQGQETAEVPVEDLSEVRTDPRTLIWVDLASPTPEELATIGQEFAIHEVALKDLEVNERQRPKVEQYPDQLLLVFYAAEVATGHHKLRLWEVDLVVGQNYLVTVHGGRPTDPEPMVRRVTARPELAAEGVGYLLYVALDELVDSFFPALDGIGERVVDLEEAVLAGAGDLQSQVFAVRKELIAGRRVIGPMRDAMVVLLRHDLPIISSETRRYLQDVYDHLIRLAESVEDYQDLIAGALDANATLAANRVNTVARSLAAYAAIFAVVTMISGIYGMNFEHLPELGWELGYPWALGLMAVGAGGLWIYFKRKGWL
jgi:magnesium transporter